MRARWRIGLLAAVLAAGSGWLLATRIERLIVTWSYRFDSFERLVEAPDKIFVECPPQDDRTAVILIAGQSNVANEATQRMSSVHGDRVLAFFDGRCMIARSPLLGATGWRGESLTAMGDALIDSGRHDRVVLIPVAIGATKIAQWANGVLRSLLEETTKQARRQWRVTHVIWHQGESDWPSTTQADYTRDFLSLVALWRAHDIDAPLLVSVATRCFSDPAVAWFPDNAVARAQRALPDPEKGIFAGPDADALIPPSERTDGDCHYLPAGQARFSRALADAILAMPGK